jgi:hypothetical protein
MSVPSKKRKNVSRDSQTAVLLRCRRRCCLCWRLRGDAREQKGQIAHIDRDPANDKFENLVFLCLGHHDAYDSRSSQAKGLTAGEIKYYKKALEAAVRRGDVPAPHGQSRSGDGIASGLPWKALSSDQQLLREAWHKSQVALGWLETLTNPISSRPDFDRTPEQQLREELKAAGFQPTDVERIVSAEDRVSAFREVRKKTLIANARAGLDEFQNFVQLNRPWFSERLQEKLDPLTQRLRTCLVSVQTGIDSDDYRFVQEARHIVGPALDPLLHGLQRLIREEESKK